MEKPCAQAPREDEGPRPSSGIGNRVSRGLHPNRLGGFEAVTSRVQREQPRPRPRTADDPEDGTGLCAQRALGDPRGRPGVLGAGVPGAARCEGSGRSPISPSHQSVRAPPISAREPPGTAPHVGPYGLATPAPDWPKSSQSEGVVSSCLANWLRGEGQGGAGLPFVLSSAAPRAPPRGPLPLGLHAAGAPTPEPGLGPSGAAGGLQAAAEALPS